MKLLKNKRILFLLPELYLIFAVLYYWILTANLLNPIAIVLLIILIAQVVSKKKGLGLFIGSIFVLLNLYMVFALISELSEFLDRTKNYYYLLIFGTLFLSLNLTVGAMMLWKYSNRI